MKLGLEDISEIKKDQFETSADQYRTYYADCILFLSNKHKNGNRKIMCIPFKAIFSETKDKAKTKFDIIISFLKESKCAEKELLKELLKLNEEYQAK